MREGVWRTRPYGVVPLPPSWPLDRDRLENALVRWPGQYNWPDASRWVDTLLSGLGTHVRIERTELPQPREHVVVIELVLDGRPHRIGIDYADLPEIDKDTRRQCDLYFKMQFHADGYGDAGIIPGGFPPGGSSLYRYLGRLRDLRGRRRFSSDVYGRFGSDQFRETRRRGVELLRSQDLFRYEGGLEGLRYGQYLHEVARAKICIDLPGIGDLCFRLIDYLAVGSCVVGPRPSTVLHVPLTDRVNTVYCSDDLSDLVPLCATYLERAEEREDIAEAARAHFDKYLERTQWAAYYLHTALDRLG